jgi:hypothetical protein
LRLEFNSLLRKLERPLWMRGVRFKTTPGQKGIFPNSM